jgi:uncharacterized membrane-anchored protein YhcB (DUF1043 family)
MKRLRENVLVSSAYYKKRSALQERESTLLVEGVTYKALAVYRFKFTRPGKENLNGRIYGYDLWGRVIRVMHGKSTLALMNHPVEDDPGDPHDIWAVWRNIGYSEDKQFVEADCYIIDNENGKTALGVLEAGGDLGLSSSGFGEFLPDGKTIDPETYEIERVADWVLDPSYEVFGRLEDKVSEGSKKTPQNINFKENKMELSERKMRKLLEANLQRICETISTVIDPFERRSKAQELLEMYSDDELGSLKENLTKMAEESDAVIREGVESGKKVSELNESLEAANISLSENQKELDSLIKENADLSKKLAEALDTLDSAKSFSQDAEKVLNEALSAKSGSVPFEKYEELREYTKNVVRAFSEQKEIIRKYGEDRQKLAKKLRQASESRKQNVAKADTARQLKERQEKNATERKALEERRAAYEAEQEKLRRANPEVVQYFKDVVRIYPELMEYKDRILSKRTEFEAQMTVMDIQHPTGEKLDESISVFSAPISSRKPIIPEPEIRFRKGEL